MCRLQNLQDMMEKIEAVGHEDLANCFATISRMLKPGATAVLRA